MVLASSRKIWTVSSGGQCVLAAPRCCSGCRGCSGSWRGRAGRPGWCWPAAGTDLDGFLGGGECVLAAPQLAVADAEVVQARGEVGREGRVVLASSPADLDGFLGGGRVRPGGAPARCSGRRGCSGLARSGRKAASVLASSRRSRTDSSVSRLPYSIPRVRTDRLLLGPPSLHRAIVLDRWPLDRAADQVLRDLPLPRDAICTATGIPVRDGYSACQQSLVAGGSPAMTGWA